MPIYEFKCMKCKEFIELILMNTAEQIETKCPKCGCKELERVLSATNYAMGSSAKGKQQTSFQTRTCSSGSCSTYTVPGVE
mmetsp:Transcript_21263/g.9782  ORF Transcript_21263/g.9782 Transcript_21263/m.9782 type:complete len:81 (-) Transcript_21263:798-1040(-)